MHGTQQDTLNCLLEFLRRQNKISNDIVISFEQKTNSKKIGLWSKKKKDFIHCVKTIDKLISYLCYHLLENDERFFIINCLELSQATVIRQPIKNS